MFQDKDCFERFAVLIVGIGVLGAVGLSTSLGTAMAAEGGGIAAHATALWARMRGQAQREAPQVVARLTRAMEAEWEQWGKTSSHADEGLRKHVRASFAEVIERLNLDPATLVGARLDAQAVADLALQRAAEVFPEAYANTDPKNAEAQLTRKFLHDVTQRAYGLLLDDAEFVSNIGPALWRAVLGQLDRVEADTKLLVKQMEKAIRELALKEGMVIGIARRIAEGVEDFDTALRELERAISIAARMERESKLPANSGDQITHILAELSRLNGENRLDDGASMVMDAFDRLEAEQARLIEIGLEQDILRRNVEGTARWVVRQVLAENAVGRFEALRTEQDRWYERGRDKGLNFDLQVSVTMARAALHFADDANERGAGQNILGHALAALGARMGDENLLLEAMNAYVSAASELNRDRVPLGWANSVSNLGSVLSVIGERRHSQELLERAILTHQAALTELTQDQTPGAWASTQNNLGNALAIMGRMEGNELLLEQAIDAYHDSIKVQGKEDFPLKWATTQNNLGAALQILGIIRGSERLLRDAATAYRAALDVWEAHGAAFDWSGAQNNLGFVLETLGQLLQCEDLLAQAISAYEAALIEWTLERSPLNWSMSFGNQGKAMRVLAEMRSDLMLAKKALAQLQLAEEVMRRSGHILNADIFAAQIPRAQALIDRLTAP